MPINMPIDSKLASKYLKGLYCICLKLEYKTGKFKYFYKIGCCHSDNFKKRLNSYHNSFPFGFLMICFLFMKKPKAVVLEAEKYCHNLLKDKRVQTTVRPPKRDGEGTSEWFDTDWKTIKEAFLKTQHQYTGWVLLNPEFAGRDKKYLSAYVPTERELVLIQSNKIKQLEDDYDVYDDFKIKS